MLVALAGMPMARANDAGPAPEVLNLGVGPGLVQITFNLLLVLAAIVVLAWLFKRVQGIQQPNVGALRVTASLALGPKERLLLIDVGDEQVLVGASAAGLTPLHVLRTPLAASADEPDEQTFKSRLVTALSGHSA